MIIKKVAISLKAHELFWLVKNEKNPVFLDSAMDPTRLGRYSIIAWDPILHFESKGNRILIKDDKGQLEYTGNPFDTLKELYGQYKQVYTSELPFCGGWIGYFGYDLCHHIEKLPRTTVDDIHLPDCVLGLYDQAVVYDHLNTDIYIVSAEIDELSAKRFKQLEMFVTEAQKPFIELSRNPEMPTFKGNFTKESYVAALEKLKDYIKSGDIYQANLTQRFTTKLQEDPAQLYYKLRAVNPAPFAAYMPLADGAILSSSPERFISLKNGIVETRPIKGTRPRGDSPEEDEAYKAELIASEKDRSELLMIVDLQRNDLSKIAKVGTVKVPELMVCETYKTVFHLVSTVVAELRPELSPIDVIEATFPGGSITGAPKIRAMEVIDELEPTQRSVYTGSIGYIGLNGDMDLNIAIRTIICHQDQACFQAGGGIVWDSVPLEEYEESLQKAKAMKRALSL